MRSHLLSFVGVGLALSLCLNGQAVVGAKKSNRNRSLKKKAPIAKPRSRDTSEPSVKIEPVKGMKGAKKIVFPIDFDTANLHTWHPMVCTLPFGSLDEVTKFADAIVLGTPTVPFLQRDLYVYYSVDLPAILGETIEGASSVGPFHIDRVLYQRKPDNNLIAGGNISLSEPVGIMPHDSGFMRYAFGAIRELKHNSQYVLFLRKRDLPGYTNLYSTFNMECGRFNVDGTDLYDEAGGRSWKEGLRQELTAAYGITFVVPPAVRLSSAVFGNATHLGNVFVEIIAPQLPGSMLTVEQRDKQGGEWFPIARVPVVPVAEGRFGPVGQRVSLSAGVLHPEASIRCRIVADSGSSDYSETISVTNDWNRSEYR